MLQEAEKNCTCYFDTSHYLTRQPTTAISSSYAILFITIKGRTPSLCCTSLSLPCDEWRHAKYFYLPRPSTICFFAHFSKERPLITIESPVMRTSPSARGIVVTSSIRKTHFATSLRSARHSPMLVTLILFVLPFLHLVSALTNATAVYGDSRIRYGAPITILMAKITNLVVIVRQESGIRQERVVDILPRC